MIHETEYSKKWAAQNPVSFTADLLEFIEQHPAPYWVFSMRATKGFLTLRAEIAKCQEVQS